MARTTIRLDEHLLAEARQYAAQTGTTLSVLIEEALRERLARPSGSELPRAEVRLPTYGEGWVRPGVDIDNSASLLDL
jgi:hypothetical protein